MLTRLDRIDMGGEPRTRIPPCIKDDDRAVVENAAEDRGGDGDVGEEWVHYSKA